MCGVLKMSSSLKKDVVLNIRIESTLKEKAVEVFEKNGIDKSKAIRMFLDHVVKLDDIPDFMKIDY